MFSMIKHFVAALLVVAASSAGATVITLETRDFDTAITEDLATFWETLDAGSITTLDEVGALRPGNMKINMLTIDFSAVGTRTWDMQFGFDGTYGAVIYMDGVELASESSDVWWRRNWNDGDVLTAEDIEITSGMHQIQLIWAERCCNGENQFRIIDQASGNISPFSVAAFDAASIPLPASVVLVALGLGILVRSKRAK